MKIKILLLFPFLTLISASAFAEKDLINQATVNQNADNTGINKRDVTPQTMALTPPDQTRGNKSDVELTRRIRELIMKEHSLSSKAHNVKIITLNGVTSLRGPVVSAAESSKIASIASEIVGGNKFVRNQMEIKQEE